MSCAAVILSPHFDDAVLSCWRLLADDGDVLVVNVFAGVPPQGTLGWWDRLAGCEDSAAAVRARIEEDRRALALTGRTAVNLDFLDDQYREREEDPAGIAAALRAVLTPAQRIYAPAALGDRHRDHLAVCTAALELHAEDYDVRLYADLPHAALYGWPRWALNGEPPGNGDDQADERWARQLRGSGLELDRMTASVARLSDRERERKLASVRAYASQLEPLEQAYGRSFDAPEGLGYEVTWVLS